MLLVVPSPYIPVSEITAALESRCFRVKIEVNRVKTLISRHPDGDWRDKALDSWAGVLEAVDQLQRVVQEVDNGRH
jgi:hypothetical protein